MSEFKPVETVADLDALDQDQIVAGYRHGIRCAVEPGNDKCRGFWHGWRNAQLDLGRLPQDAACARLCREFRESGRGLLATPPAPEAAEAGEA